LLSTIILPIFCILPKQASIAIMYGFLYLEFIIEIVSFKFLACTGFSKLPNKLTLPLIKNLSFSPTRGPKESPVDLSVPMHTITISLFALNA